MDGDGWMGMDVDCDFVFCLSPRSFFWALPVRVVGLTWKVMSVKPPVRPARMTGWGQWCGKRWP